MSGRTLASAAATDCLRCGSFVSEHYRRVFGDGQDRAHRCPECDSKRRIQAGSAAGKDVPIPDPQDHPERHRGESP